MRSSWLTSRRNERLWSSRAAASEARRRGGLLAGLALAYVLVRWPTLTPIALLAAAPFRIPVDLGSQHAFLLLPLYGVLAAAVLAFCWQAVTSAVNRVLRTV